MAEGWKQVWEDILNAIRGESPPAEQPKPAEEPRPPPAPEATAVAVDEPAIDSPRVDAVEEIDSSSATIESVEETDSPLVAAEAVGEAVSPLATAEAVEAVSLEPAPLPPAEPVGEAIPTSAPSEAHSTPIAPTEPEPIPAEAEATVETEVEAKLTPRQLWLGRIRTVAFYALLAVLFVVALWFSGGSKYWAEWTAPKPPASDVIATFDGGQITIADVEAHLKLLVPEEYVAAMRSPETMVAVVEDMIMDGLVRRWAATRQPDADENFSHTMQHISESLNLESLDTQRHEGEINVTESEIQDYYNANKDQFGELTLDQVREQIRQLLVSEREQGYIEGYLQRLKDNASITRNFELLDVPPPAEDDLRRYYDANLDQFKLPRQVVVDELQFPISGDEAAARQDADDALLKVRSGATFDEVGQAIPRAVVSNAILVPEGVSDPAWDAAVFALTISELSDVFRAGEAFYIVRLNELQPARTQSLDEVRPTVLTVVQQQKTDEWFEANASQTLLTLKGKQYTLGQFYQEYRELSFSVQSQFAGPEGMKALAEQLIERLLLVEDTTDQLLDVQNKPLVDEARLQVLKQMLHQEEIDDKIEVADEAMQKFYDENQALMALPPQSRIRYIRIGLGSSDDEQQTARTRADEAYKKLVPGLLQQGADFAVVAQEYSEDPETAANGGELPAWIGESNDILAEAEIHPFHEAILLLQPNDISQPFQFGDSLYIVQVIERTEPQQLTLEEAKPYIQDILTAQKHEELLAQLTDDLFQQANVVIYRSILEAYLTQLATPAPFDPQP